MSDEPNTNYDVGVPRTTSGHIPAEDRAPRAGNETLATDRQAVVGHRRVHLPHLPGKVDQEVRSDNELSLIYQLIRVGAEAVNQRLVLGSGGNLSARVPGSDRFVITGAATWLDRLEVADFSVVDLSGDVLAGATRPSSEWKLHQQTYLRRDDVNSVIHVHPQYAVLIDAMDEPIRLVTLDHAYYVRAVGRVPYLPSGSDDLAAAAADVATDHDAMVLAFHGCSALGADIDMAFRRATNLEEAATATYRLLALGDRTTTFPREHLARLHHD